MPRRSSKTQIACEFFNWTLFTRDGVYYADGRNTGLKKYSLNTRDFDEATANLRRLDRKIAIERGLAVTPTEPQVKDVTIAEGWRRFLDQRGRPHLMGGVSPGTLKRYRQVQTHHIAFCNTRGIESWLQIDKSATENFGKWRAPKIADPTLKFELELVVSVLKYLISEEKLLSASQLFSLRLSKPQDSDRYCFKREEVRAMVAHCRQTPGLAWFADVIIGLATTGLRSESLNGLRWSEVDLPAGVIRIRDERFDRRKKSLDGIRTMKGKRHHTLPIHPSFRQVLERLPKANDGLVFHGPRGGHLHARNNLQTLQSQVIEPLKATFPTPPGEVGFEHAVIHSFRHFFCSEAFRQGASEAQVLEWLGNRDSNMIKIYRHLRPDDSKAKMNGIDFLGDGTGPSPT
jgi:integrase